MADALKYKSICKYVIKAKCSQPMHIGSALGDKEEVLIHPLDEIPFIQASSIAGAFRDYHESLFPENTNTLFGARKMQENGNANEYSSRIKFEDGHFEKCMLELRPHVSIDRETGSCKSSIGKGTIVSSGHKFNMEYIGVGSIFSFSIYLYDEEYKNQLESIISAIKNKELTIGGQQSNGCGTMELISVKRKCFNMEIEEDRKNWFREDSLEDSEYEEISDDLQTNKESTIAYEIIVNGETEGSLLVKSIAVSAFGEGAPDCMNIQNAQKEYIVPGSSFKGAIRNQMEKISEYINHNKIIADTFGYVASGNNSSGKLGNIRFEDTVIGDCQKNDRADLSYRIHIDKFTGGVMQSGLFCEKNVFGEMQFRILINKRSCYDASCGLLILALRDLAIGTMSIGSGYNVGKGFIKVNQIMIYNQNGQKAIIDVLNNQIQDENDIVTKCLAALYEGGAVNED